MAMLDPHRITTVDWNGHVLTERVGAKEAQERFQRRADGEGVRYCGLFGPDEKVMREYFRDWATHAYQRNWRAA